ncbi:MAG: hypothetical protein HY286_04875 [Planctomycetes bacterium]|nr:hypothetical protein [Planctomycetota bacterium]
MTTAVLVIHPDVRARKRIRDAATRRGLTVVASADAREAMLIAHESAPWAIVVKLSPIEMNSFDLLKSLRAVIGPDARMLAIGFEDGEKRERTLVREFLDEIAKTPPGHGLFIASLP